MREGIENCEPCGVGMSNSSRVGDGDCDCFVTEPARAREIKLIRRSRFRVLTGEACTESGEGLESAGRSVDVGSLESIDQREAGGMRVAAGRRFTDDSRGDARDVTREAKDG